MELTNSEKIRVLMKRKKVKLYQIANLLDMSRQSLYVRLKNDDFNKNELNKIATFLDVGYESNFVLEDGTKL